jgi:hypothetical protein
MTSEPTSGSNSEPATIECPAGHENQPGDLRTLGLDYLCPDCGAKIEPGRVLAVAGEWP